MRHLNDDGGDDDVVPVILPTEDVPFILPLISAKRTKEQLRPRRGAKFDILASDLSSDGEDKYDEQRSKRDYRRFQMEFVRCYAGAAIITLCIAYFVLMRPIILGRKWQYSKVSKLPPPIWETITDVRRAENFKEKLKKFFFDDDGFD
jgi:hypothetical protein